MITSQHQMRLLSIIHLSMKDDIIPHIFHLDNLDDVWNVLKELYESVGTTRGLMNKFYKMSMQETRNMVNFLFIVKNLLGQTVKFIDVNI